MRDTHTLNKSKFIFGIVILCCFSVVGLVGLFVTICALLNHIGVEIPFCKFENNSTVEVLVGFVFMMAWEAMFLFNLIIYIKKLKLGDFSKSPLVHTINIIRKNKNDSKSVEANVSLGNSSQSLYKPVVSEKKEINKKFDKKYALGWVLMWAGITSAFFIFAIVLLILGITNNTGKELYLGIGILVFLLPCYYISIVSIINYRKFKNGQSSVEFNPYIIIISVCIALGSMPLTFFNSSESKMPTWAVWTFIGFCGFIILICSISWILEVINNQHSRLVMKGIVGSYDTTAKFHSAKLKSITSGTMNGVPTVANIRFKIKYTYVDKLGKEISKTSVESYSLDEVKYLKKKGIFTIKISEYGPTISEDLSEIENKLKKYPDTKNYAKTNSVIPITLK